MAEMEISSTKVLNQKEKMLVAKKLSSYSSIENNYQQEKCCLAGTRRSVNVGTTYMTIYMLI